MLKLRIQGAESEIKNFLSYLKKQPDLRIVDTSELYENRGTTRYKRLYTNVVQTKDREFIRETLLGVDCKQKPMKIVLREDKIKQYFDGESNIEEIENIIFQLLEDWKQRGEQYER